ncbi:MAG TPA: phosphatidate cytidylyltransferase [Fimbriimonadaceae bacterium]|nr:phosphatidate cytidylyltransferase [Fimbriimonadaceae bacterium]
MRARVLTALALIPLVLLAVFSTSPLPLLILGGLAVVISSLELAHMTTGRRSWIPPVGGLILWGAGAWALVQTQGWAAWLPGLAGLGILAWAAIMKGCRRWIYIEIAGLYPASALYSLALLHQLLPAAGAWNMSNVVLLALLPLWAGDTAAIFIGRSFGKTPLAPAISPNKTWEGAVANLLAALAVALALAPWLGIDLRRAALAGLAMGVLGQAGDLLESALKRSLGQKDSGSLLPGHGGLLDRIDSLLLASLGVWLILR